MISGAFSRHRILKAGLNIDKTKFNKNYSFFTWRHYLQLYVFCFVFQFTLYLNYRFSVNTIPFLTKNYQFS